MICDRQTDRQTDTLGKTICLPTLKGGDIMILRYRIDIMKIHKILIFLVFSCADI